MKLKLALSTASALGLLMTAALANDANTAFTDQNGDSNQILIQQGAGFGGNDVGKPTGTGAGPILQLGDFNKFSETQSLGGNVSNIGNNDITAAKQHGDTNTFSSNYSNGAGHNLIESVLQYGNTNWASIGRNGQTEGRIGTIVQGNEGSEASGGNGNYLTITQSSGAGFVDGNVIETVKQIGSNNGSAGPSGPQNPDQWGTRLSQNGNGNLISESTIIGSNNRVPGFNTGYNDVGTDASLLAPNSSALRSVHRISQRGTDNGLIASRAVTRGSDGNYIFVDQNGDRNQFDLVQGIDSTSTRNAATALQKGNDNDVSDKQNGSFNYFASVQTGNGNVLDGEQYGDTNTIRASFTGNNNGTGTLTGNAGTLVSGTTIGLHGHLMRNGLITQDGFNNTADLTVSTSGNMFAFLQKGNNNTIDGTVSSDDNNQAAVRQVGNNNNSTFEQSGLGNNLSVAQ